MIVSLVSAGKRVGISANSHKVIGNLLRPGPGGRGRGGRRRCGRPEGDRGRPGHRPPGGDRHEEQRGRAGRPGRRLDRRRRRHVVALGVRQEQRRCSTSCSSTRPARSRWPTCWPWPMRPRSIVLLGDPQQLDQPLQGSHPPGADRSALAHLLGGRRHAAARPSACSSSTRGGCIRTFHRVHLDRLLRRPARVAARARATSRSAARTPLRGAGVRLLAADHVGADSVSPQRGDPGRRHRPRAGRQRFDLDRRDGQEHADRRTATSWSSRRTTPRSARSRACCHPGRASGPSTSSRARRRRSASTR